MNFGIYNILNKYHVQGVEDFDKLKTIGKELTVLITNIEKNLIFYTISKVMMLIYYSFIQDLSNIF